MTNIGAPRSTVYTELRVHVINLRTTAFHFRVDYEHFRRIVCEPPCYREQVESNYRTLYILHGIEFSDCKRDGSRILEYPKTISVTINPLTL